MTETTEEKDLIAAIESCIEGDLGPAYDLSNGLHMTAKEAAAFGSWLNGELQDLETQVSSLTKERDELKDDVTKRMEVADIICKENRDLKSLLSKAEEENKKLKGNSEIFYIDPDDPYLEERSSLELAASMVSFNGGPVVELQVYAKKRLPNIFIIKHGCEHKAFTTKEEALSSLNKSKGEEE